MKKSLEEIIESNRNNIVNRLVELINIESPSLDPIASKIITDNLAARLNQLGATVTRHQTEVGVHLIADIPGSDDSKPVLLVGHSDTVWPLGSLANTVPLVVTDNCVKGPGAYDMRSGLVIIESALRYLLEYGQGHRPVRIIITADEEVGSASSRAYVAKAAEGVEFALGFEAPHPDGAFKIGRRGSSRVRVDVVGVEAHAALDPDKGVSAIEELIDQIQKIQAYVTSVSSSENEVLLNLGTIEGGTMANVIAGSANIVFGLRFIDLDTENKVLDFFRNLRPIRDKCSVSATLLSNRPAWRESASDDAILAQLRAALPSQADKLSGRPAAGAGDLNFVAALGVPSIDGFGPMGAGAHAVHEHIMIDSLIERVSLLAHILLPKLG